MDRDYMENIMLEKFAEIVQPYITKGFITTASLSTGVDRWIKGCMSPSFYYDGNYVSVDFACGAGCKVGAPTNFTHITVIKGDYFERFTFNQLIKKYLGAEQQLTLF